MKDKKKLLVILGAGSSIPCGMPSVEDIDKEMRHWSSQWEARPTFQAGHAPDVFNTLWNTVESYYRRAPQTHLGIKANFEKILGEMTALANWVTPSSFGNTLAEALNNPAVKDILLSPTEEHKPYFWRQLITQQIDYLITNLASFMRRKCHAFNSHSIKFTQYKGIFSQLRDAFDVGIYNLNYDTVAQSAWPDAFNGFIGESFAAREVGKRQEWGFIYPLHGSVHYSFMNSQVTRQVIWQEDLSGDFIVSEHLKSDMASEFRPIVPATLVAGGFKLDQLLADPAQSFHASLVRHIHEADAFLIIGYGFGDIHVNRALRSRFELFPNRQSQCPPAVVITKSRKNDPSVECRQAYDFWARELKASLRCAFFNNQRLKGNAMTTAPFLEGGIFEKALNDRVAVCHEGFPTSDTTTSNVIRHLNA